MSITSRQGESEELDLTQRNSARDQALMREVNDQVCAFAAAATPEGPLLVSCECSDLHCSLPLSVAQGDYERIRQNPARFIVTPGHTGEIGDRVIEESDGFVVVEKVGEAAEIATRLDSRREFA